MQFLLGVLITLGGGLILVFLQPRLEPIASRYWGRRQERDVEKEAGTDRCVAEFREDPTRLILDMAADAWEQLLLGIGCLIAIVVMSSVGFLIRVEFVDTSDLNSDKSYLVVLLICAPALAIAFLYFMQVLAVVTKWTYFIRKVREVDGIGQADDTEVLAHDDAGDRSEQ